MIKCNNCKSQNLIFHSHTYSCEPHCQSLMGHCKDCLQVLSDSQVEELQEMSM